MKTKKQPDHIAATTPRRVTTDVTSSSINSPDQISKRSTDWLQKLGSQYVAFAERLYGRTFANDADLTNALLHEPLVKINREEFLSHFTSELGFEFTSPLEVFQYFAEGHLPDFEPLAPPAGAPTMFEVAEKIFGRPFLITKDLTDYISEDPKRDFILNRALVAAGWRSKKKTRTERIPISKADELFNRFVDGIAKANANRKFAFFVEEAIVFGSYMRRDKATIGDIDIALSFAMKTETKLNRRIQYYMRREGVDWKGGYDKAIGEVSESIIRSKHFHQAATDYVKRRFPFRVVYEMPDREQYARLASYTDNWNSVEHLHEFVEEAERKRARANRKGKSASV